jgi:hypothetical protein
VGGSAGPGRYWSGFGLFDSPDLDQDKPEFVGVLASQDAGDQGGELRIEMEACASDGPDSLMSQWPDSTGARHGS